MKRLGSFGLLVAAASIVSAMPSCESRSLVLIDVQASAAFDAESVHLENVRLTVTANRNLTTRFPPVRLSTTRPYQIGVYLPPDMTGRVTFEATIDDGTCVWGTGSAVAPNVQGGNTTALADPLAIEPTGSCVPISGTGTAGAGGMTGAAGAGGMTGAAGAGAGGVTGAAGVTGVAGSSGVAGGGAGASGRGGVTGTAGIGGAAGRGGAIGTAGSGPAGTLGTAGIGGMTGIAGRGGTTGIAGSGPAGTLGTAGTSPVGSAGRGGTVGTAGNLGTGGTVTCICADPKRVCDLSGACVCAQSPPQACLNAGIQCGYTTNNCGEQVFCDCLLANAFCELTTGRCLTTCVSGTGGPITTQEAEIICPDQPTSQ